MKGKYERVAPGKVIEFEYPRHNFYGVYSRMESRKIRVERIRDLRQDPIEDVTFEIQPLLRRSRYLVTGTDLERNQERSFYLDSMQFK